VRYSDLIVTKKQPIITEEELWQALDDAAKPIDFEALLAEGIIEKDGAWYKVPDMKALPKHASRKIKTVKTGPKGIRVQFRPASKAAVSLLKKRPKRS